MRMISLKTSALAAVLVAGSAVTGWAQGPVTMQLSGVSDSATDVGITSGPQGMNAAPGQDYIGLYQFTITAISGTVNPGTQDSLIPSSGLYVGETFNSVCLSPNGGLGWSPYTYDYDNFAQAAGSAIPAAWATSNGVPVGIQNAAYLWQLFGSKVTSGAQGAGLAMAMYAALYQSTGYGVLGNPNNFVPNFSQDAAAGAAYASYLSYLTTFGSQSSSLGVAANALNGYMLVPDPLDGTQEFIILSPTAPNLTPVPEPTTFIAGGLLLLPLGASTLRILRKRKA